MILRTRGWAGWTIMGSALALAVVTAVGCGKSEGDDDGSLGPGDAAPESDARVDSGPNGGDGSVQSEDAGPRDDFPAPIFDTDAPASSPQVFAGSDVAGAGPCTYEPQMGSLFPKNWQRLRFRSKISNAENLFEIKLSIPNQKHPLIVYTTKSSYALDAATWSKVVETGIGKIHVTVRSAKVDDGGATTGGPWIGTEGDIEIADVEASGRISYFSTPDSAVKGFTVGDETVANGPTPSDVSGGTTCVGCHSPTPDGQFAALTTSPTSGGLALRPIAGGTANPPFLGAGAKQILERTGTYSATFSKAHWTAGDRTLVSMYQNGGKTELVWIDLEASSPNEGTAWGQITRDDTNSASSAAWSHDGTKVAYVSSASPAHGTSSVGGRIAIVPLSGRVSGAVTFVPGASDSEKVSYYPSFSADDAYLVFNQLPKGSNSYNNSNAELFVVPSGGAATPHRLAANDPAACLGVTTPGITSSWPRWSPTVATQGQRKIYFLTFSSTRFEGVRQVFVAPVVAEGTTITSYPAIYPWNQASDVGNHTPSWSEL